MKNFQKTVAIALIFTVISACGNLTKKPIDAKTRDIIDSVANAQCRQIRSELDTFYNQNHPVLMQKLMDSLMVERRKEIEKQVQSARTGK